MCRCSNAIPSPGDYTSAIDGKPERESYLLCIDPKTGKNLWRHVRPTDAKNESQESYSSPIPDFSGQKPPEIIIVGGNCTTAHDAKTGEELWRCGGLNSHERSVFPHRAVAGRGGRDDHRLRAQKGAGLRHQGRRQRLGDRHARSRGASRNFRAIACTPLYYKGKLFVLDGDKQMMTCLDPKTGAKKWQGSMGIARDFPRVAHRRGRKDLLHQRKRHGGGAFGGRRIQNSGNDSDGRRTRAGLHRGGATDICSSARQKLYCVGKK